MHFFEALAVSLLALSTWATPALAARKPSDAVLLSDVKSLTFRSGKQTTHRRVSAIPQLKCTGGSARGLYEPDTIRCTNSGSSYSSADVEWTCTASVPPEFKLGSTDVICEGYSSPDDTYVLKGSCGLEYRLILTELGNEKYGKRRDGGDWGAGGGGGIVPVLFWVLFGSVVAWMIYSAFFQNRTGRPAPGGGRRAGRREGFFGGWGGGGGGDDGNDDPPPPYSPPPYTPKKAAPSASTYSYAAPRTRNTNQGWRPGFWTGAATGAAASYLAGGRGAGARQQPQMQQQQRNWWGGGASNGAGTHDPGEGSSGARRTPGGSSSGPAYSGSRYTSTGFGSTSRR